MAFIILLRIAIGGLILWLLWRLYTTYIAPKRPARSNDPDEWGDVLTAIDELPETTDPPPQTQAEASQQPSSPPQPQVASDDAVSKAHLESAILREAEQALSIIKQANEGERLAAYHEIVTYEKLVNLADFAVSEQTGAKLANLHRQAQDIIRPPDQRSRDTDADGEPKL